MISTRPLPSRSCRSAVKDGRTGAATTSYLAKTALVSGIDNPGPDDLAYAYNAHGRLSRTDRSKTSTSNISTYQEYNRRGQVTRRWGSAATPIEYAYDAAYGHLTHQKTYRAGSAWESSTTWPSSPGTADTTQWEVDPATGLLKKKIDAANNEVRFEYNDRGQLKKRILARDSNGNAATQYRYDANTAELSTVDYPGTMTDIVYTYTRLGALKSVVDATTGTRTFTFRTSDYQLASEQLPSGFYGTKRFLSPVYSTASGTNGRLTGLKYGTSVGSSSALSVTYGYEGTTGRLRTVGAHNKTMTYAYQSNSNLVNQVSSGSYAMTRTWESDRNLVTSVATAWGSTSKVLHRYHYDALNRRTAEFKRGEMFDIYGGTSAVGIGRKYQYDDNAGLISAIDYLDPDADYQTTDLSTRVKGRRFGYAYDNQGNRTTSGTTVNYRESAESNLRTANYTVNSRNQYTQRQVPAFVDVAGASSGTVTVTGNTVSHTVTKQGDYFYALLDDNGTNGYNNADDDLKVTVAVSAGGELNEGDVHVAEDVELFTYDLDGNLTSDGLWDYSWDAENRLTAMTMKSGLPTGMIRKRLEFKYDYLGRRVQKIVKNNWTGTSGTTVTHLKYVYDGHNLIAELDGSVNSKPVLSTYVWGLDLSGTMWGAGGVGGLLMVKDGTKTYFPAYDGKGNVSALLDSADGSLDAKYEYGAFGEPLRVGGSAIAADNPFRFSTKYTDTESGLVYYGFRYYSPSLGRFLNRDPIGEAGGTNLYGFVENDPVNGWDYLGLDDELICGPSESEAGLCDDDGGHHEPERRGFFKRLGSFFGSIFGTGTDESIYREYDGEGIAELEEKVFRYDRSSQSKEAKSESSITIEEAEFDLPWYIDVVDVGFDIVSAGLVVVDIAFAGPTGEGIAPAAAIMAGKQAIKAKAKQRLIERLLKSAAKGRKIHKAWKPGKGFKKEYHIPGFGRADAVDRSKLIIKELKPNNPRAIRRGLRQLERYKKGLEKIHPETKGKWKTILETY